MIRCFFVISLFIIVQNASSDLVRPLIVAHRGASADAPENTVAAFELAWKQGADAIEGDFHLTRDRKIVCIHDKDTKKLNGKNVVIRKTRLDEIRNLDAGSWKDSKFAGIQIPTFSEVLATVPQGKKLYVEIKSSPKIILHILKQIDESGIDPYQLVIIAFSERVVKKIKSQRPSLKVCWLTALKIRDKSGLSPTAEEILKTLRSTKADGVNVYAHPNLDKEFVDTIRNAGFEFHAWTVDDPERAKELAAMGVQSITTNVPKKMLEQL